MCSSLAQELGQAQASGARRPCDLRDIEVGLFHVPPHASVPSKSCLFCSYSNGHPRSLAPKSGTGGMWRDVRRWCPRTGSLGADGIPPRPEQPEQPVRASLHQRATSHFGCVPVFLAQFILKLVRPSRNFPVTVTVKITHEVEGFESLYWLPERVRGGFLLNT